MHMKLKNTLIILLAVVIVGAGFILPAEAVTGELVILHTNDLHGRIEMDEGLLGLPGIAGLISRHRAEYEHVLVMDAGDTIHGRPITNLLQGESTAEGMNRAGYDVMVPGNHDFNFGYERLLELEEMMEFDLVAANVEKDGELIFAPYVIKDMGDFKVGVIGLATPDTISTTHPANIRGLEFTDMVAAAGKYTEILQDSGVDLIVALGHVGLSGENTSARVVEAVEGIDIFVDGHSHDRLPEGKWVGDTLIVQAHEYGKYLGRVLVDLSGETPSLSADLIPADVDDLTIDEDLKHLMEEYRGKARDIMLGN